MFRILWIVVFFMIYAHLYVHFVISPNNSVSTLTDLTKEDITQKVYEKLPFLMDGKDMASNSLFEPYVRFVSEKRMCTQKKWTETHPACRTFYRVDGEYEVTCIHPKYKDLMEHKKLFKQNPKILRFVVKDMVLFVPNEWIVQFKRKTGQIERIEYRTPLNQVALAMRQIFK